jgi:ribosomal protein L11 methyltransferase
MDYISCKFFISPVEPFRDILMSEMDELPFDSFEEFDHGLIAYCNAESFSESAVKDTLSLPFFKEASITFQVEPIAKQNWNKQWEESFTPIIVADKFSIRGPFHKPTGLPIDLVIEPKMSFGTGHHETTRLICEFLLENPPKNQNILDVGTGTGVLAIMGLKLGANYAFGTDIDPWSIENAFENAKVNGVDNQQYNFVLGDIEVIPANTEYELVLANINKLVLMKHLPHYFRFTKNKGTLVLSGFFVYDADDLIEKATEVGFSFKGKVFENDWCALTFSKE